MVANKPTSLTLYRACNELQVALDRHEKYLKSEISQLDGRIAEQHAATAKKEDEISDCKVKVATASTRLAFLDCEEHEKLQLDAIEGQTIYQRERKYISLPSKFTFELKTKHPIRDHRVVKDQGVNWDWRSMDWLGGAKTFKVTIKAKPFKEAEAEIELYGWRKEIHAAEIFDLQRKTH